MLRSTSSRLGNFRTKTIDVYKKINTRLTTKVKGTFIERLVNYIKTICNDYKEVAISVRQDIKERPVKAAFFFTGMSFLGLSLKTNPSEQSFKAKFIQCANEVAMVAPSIVNPSIVQHLTYVQKCYNTDLIRHRSLGFFSVIWVDKYSDRCNVYENNCSYLQIPYRHLTNRIIDVGFLNIWWVMSRKMLDYDLNY